MLQIENKEALEEMQGTLETSAVAREGDEGFGTIGVRDCGAAGLPLKMLSRAVSKTFARSGSKYSCAVCLGRRRFVSTSSTDRARIVDIPLGRHGLPEGLLAPRAGATTASEHRASVSCCSRYAWL